VTVAPYSPDQTDALEELANVAMGQAGASLAMILDLFVTLSVPRSRIVCAEEVAIAVASMIDDPRSITAVRQAFFNQLRGEAIVLFGPNGCANLADRMGHEPLDMAAPAMAGILPGAPAMAGILPGADDPDGPEVENELLLDVSNILVGAVLNGLAEQLETDFSFSAPALMALRQPVLSLLAPDRLGWSHALLIEVNFALEERDFRCHLILLMPEESIEHMRESLNGMLAHL